MVPFRFSPSRTRGEDTPMAGISTRTGGERGRRRHDPTGKSMTWVVRVGAAAGLVVVGTAAGRPDDHQTQHDHPPADLETPGHGMEAVPSRSTAAAGRRSRWP